MLQEIKAILILVLSLALLAGCVTPQQQQRVDQDLAEMKRRLAESEQALVALRKDVSGQNGGQISGLARNQADLRADFDGLRAEMQRLAGQVDERSGRNQNLEAQIARLRDELNFKVKAIEERLAHLESAPAPQAAVPSPAPANAEELYQKGLDAIRQDGDFVRGRQNLEAFLQKNPRHPLAINAKYWIGEAWYGEKKYENAILQFQDVIQEFGDHPKVASALLKQGMAFQALGDQPNARVIYQKVVERFPLSEEAKKAKELMK